MRRNGRKYPDRQNQTIGCGHISRLGKKGATDVVVVHVRSTLEKKAGCSICMEPKDSSIGGPIMLTFVGKKPSVLIVMNATIQLTRSRKSTTVSSFTIGIGTHSIRHRTVSLIIFGDFIT